MAFDQEPTRAPVAIGNIVVQLKDAAAVDERPAYQAAYFQIKVELSDGSMIERSGDLALHITPAQRQALMDFMASLRTQAENEIL